MKLSDSLKSLAKVALKPRHATVRRRDDRRPLVILGNGPSLLDTVRDHAAELEQCALMAVNFAANTELFTRLKPEYYTLADPHFFAGAETDANVARLLANLNTVTWPMTLFVPFGARVPLSNPLVTVERFPMTGVEGYGWLERLFYSARLGMPRPRNVLIPSIMLGVWMGYGEIYLTGADHSWMQTIRVDEENYVLPNQPHFYKDNEEAARHVRDTYRGIRLHEVIMSFYVAFRSYHRIRQWVDALGTVRIYNATPGSMIDAFPRRSQIQK